MSAPILCAPCGGVYPCVDCRARWYDVDVCDYSLRSDNDLDCAGRLPPGRIYPSILDCKLTGSGWSVTASNQAAQWGRDAARYAAKSSPRTPVLGETDVVLRLAS